MALCAVLVVVGIVARTYELGFPERTTFDERHFVEKGARNYLAHQRDRNEHPPLGKLAIALSIARFGDASWAWRVPSLLAGIAVIGAAALVAGLLFRNRLAAFLTAMLVALDGFFLGYSRTACIDSLLVLCFLLCVFWTLRARSASDLALGAIFAGLAASTKTSGVVLLAPLVASCVVHRARLPRFTIATVVLAPAVYTGIYSYGLWLSRQPIEPWAETIRMYEKQKRLTDWLHPMVSHWSTWWLPAHPLPLASTRVGKRVLRVMVSLPNLAVGWTSFALAFGSFCRIASLGPRRLLARLREPGQGFFEGDLPAVCWLVFLWVLPIVPWMLFERDSYYNHYLPSYAFSVILLGGGLARLFRTQPLLVWLFAIVTVVVFVVYLPIWIELPIRIREWRQLLFLEVWRDPRILAR
jgi:dolichyl-phosphate-mannose--protein O-mannosyl transferase